MVYSRISKTQRIKQATKKENPRQSRYIMKVKEELTAGHPGA